MVFTCSGARSQNNRQLGNCTRTRTSNKTHIWTKGGVGAPLNWFKPSSKIFLLIVPRRCFFCGSFMLFLSCFCFHARLFVDVLWSPAGKWLTSWLSFVMFNCEVVTFPLVSWVGRCGAWLYRFLVFALFLTLRMLNASLTRFDQLWRISINLMTTN